MCAERIGKRIVPDTSLSWFYSEDATFRLGNPAVCPACLARSFLAVIDDGKVVRIPGEAKAREEWCAACREREFCFSCIKKTPDGMIAIRGFV
ncbi:hypothetical protein SI90_02270 [Akkermansia muciniphila]|jgi:hypothetical protein|nr:hypothetical protein C1O57_07970 [Akkermansia muciniphila]QAR49574.1 hypothetical protein SI90_02270 [Akkermansia muciniphila]